jgi:hypothetical protein
MSFRDATIALEDGTSLHASIHDGTSVPILFLHDLDCSAYYWSAVVARLLELDSELHLIALDLRGHGKSSCSGETSRKRLVQDAKRVCKALGIEGAVLCGHGWGADIALAADWASSAIAINPLFGREASGFEGDIERPAHMHGAISPEVLQACRIGISSAKPIRRNRRDAPLLLVTSDPADTQVSVYPEIADAAVEAYAWQDGSRHLPLEAPAGIAALVLAWIEEVA